MAAETKPGSTPKPKDTHPPPGTGADPGCNFGQTYRHDFNVTQKCFRARNRAIGLSDRISARKHHCITEGKICECTPSCTRLISPPGPCDGQAGYSTGFRDMVLDKVWGRFGPENLFKPYLKPISGAGLMKLSRPNFPTPHPKPYLERSEQ